MKNNIYELIGDTPVLKYKSIDSNEIYIKLESYNIGGSVKDRIAKEMILGLKEQGILTKDSKVVESTSGNTGIALAMLLAYEGIHLSITMPENMSKERVALLKAYGAEVILTPKGEGMKGAIAKAKELEAQGYIYIDQFNNELNKRAHERYTAKEIEKEFGDSLDYIVMGVGTSGTLSGVSPYLKSINPKLKVVAVEPEESQNLKGGAHHPHAIQGIGAGFMPPLYNKDIVDEIIDITTAEANEEAKNLAHEGLLLGVSSAAAIKAAKKIAQREKNKKILCIAPDNGMKYISLGIYE